MIRVEHGNMLEVLPRLAAEGVLVDSVVCDPPYHLTSIVKRFGGKDAAPAMVGATGAYARAFLAWLERQAWLLESHIELRTLAYYTICRRADKLKAAAGISTLDDALGDKPTLGKLARDVLRLR